MGLSYFIILVAECTYNRIPLNTLTMCMLCVMIVIVFCLFSDSSIMNDYRDHVPFLISPRWHQQGLGSHRSLDYDYNDPLYEGSKSKENMEDGGANDGSHYFRQEEEVEPPPLSPASSHRIGHGDQEEKRS